MTSLVLGSGMDVFGIGRATNLAGARVALTGAGRGLGAALAITLADLGCCLVLTGRDMTALRAVAEAIERRTSIRPECHELDLTDGEQIERVAAVLDSDPRALDILINNGAMWLAPRPTPYTPMEVAGVVNSTITGTMLVTQALLPALMRSDRPDVLTVGSCNALPGAKIEDVSLPFYAAKQGQRALAEGFEMLFSATPVRWQCLHPPKLVDVSPLDPIWNDVSPHEVSNRDIVELAIYALTRPRYLALASLVVGARR